MKVHELIQILTQCDPEMEIASHANHHTAFDVTQRVVELKTWAGNFIAIGNFMRRHTNHPNEFVLREVDGGPTLPDNYR